MLSSCDWRDIAICAFWLRHPEALDAQHPYRPAGLTRERQRFLRLGLELQILESDLKECVNEFKTAYEALYNYPAVLHLKKFSIVYHVDNFHVRVHKLKENLVNLIRLGFGLEVRGSQRIKEALARRGLDVVVEALDRFERHPRVAAAIQDRHRFVHEYREGRHPLLEVDARMRDLERDEDELTRGIRWVTEVDALDTYADRKASDFLEILGCVETLREEMCEAVVGHVVSVIKGRPGGVPGPLRPFVDLWEF